MKVNTKIAKIETKVTEVIQIHMADITTGILIPTLGMKHAYTS